MKHIAFDAVASSDAQVLILGSLPGGTSLLRREYYAYSHNSFWWIMGQLVGANPALPYSDRLERLKSRGIALWDVCRAAERSGSSDSNILLPTVEANNFAAFFSTHSCLQLIAFNGRAAETIFRRMVVPVVPQLDQIAQQLLPSTSPAHAGLSREMKLLAWRKALAPFIDVGENLKD